MIEHLKEVLNQEQYQAVVTTDRPLLIIAGAGSGKTRMITYRIAYLVQQGISPKCILALTFTNKAAQEMQYRVSKLLQTPVSDLTVSTFHSFGLQVIKDNAHLLGYPKRITVFDAQDTLAMIKEVLQEPSVSRLYSMPGQAASYISRRKSGLEIMEEEHHPLWDELFREYQAHLKTYQAVDFDDLLSLPIELFQAHPDVLESYRRQYQHILVDEFQDTSRIQYQLLSMIASSHRNICAVGDDDQSIYSWRGADVGNFSDFEKDFPEVLEIKLEQNYRSTGNILEAANSLIANNILRKQKTLWTGDEQGLPLYLKVLEHEAEEAQWISSKIRELKAKHHWGYGSFGILVRTNSLMGVIESELVKETIPYSVSGGQSFFARKEVKDIISYLRILANPHNDVDFLRILNTPRRGLGKRTVDQLRNIAKQQGCSLFSAAKQHAHAKSSSLQSRSQEALQNFLHLIDSTGELASSGHPITEIINALLDRIEYRQYLLQEHTKDPRVGQWKYSQVERFCQFLSQWEENHRPGEISFIDYLNRIALTGKQEPDTSEGNVKIMTIHAAKGLEFPCVFLPAAEDGIIPHKKSMDEHPKALEEERRLFYVALTRAQEHLYVSRCRKRKFLKESREAFPSPFLQEIPEQFITSEQQSPLPSSQEVLDCFARLRTRLG